LVLHGRASVRPCETNVTRLNLDSTMTGLNGLAIAAACDRLRHHTARKLLQVAVPFRGTLIKVPHPGDCFAPTVIVEELIGKSFQSHRLVYYPHPWRRCCHLRKLTSGLFGVYQLFMSSDTFITAKPLVRATGFSAPYPRILHSDGFNSCSCAIDHRIHVVTHAVLHVEACWI